MLFGVKVDDRDTIIENFILNRNGYLMWIFGMQSMYTVYRRMHLCYIYAQRDVPIVRHTDQTRRQSDYNGQLDAIT